MTCQKCYQAVDESGKCACQRQSVKYYRYYDSPDGCDVAKKVAVTTRYGVITGLLAGTADVLLYSHPQGTIGVLKRFMFHVGPLAAMGATFALVANTALNARDVDDELNYFMGGLACGPIAACYFRSGYALVAGGLALGVAGVIKKMSVDADFPLFPVIIPRRSYVTSERNDFTFVKDPKITMLETCGKEKQ